MKFLQRAVAVLPAAPLFCASLLCAFGGNVLAQGAYPNKPIRLITPFLAGGSTTTNRIRVRNGRGGEAGVAPRMRGTDRTDARLQARRPGDSPRRHRSQKSHPEGVAFFQQSIRGKSKTRPLRMGESGQVDRDLQRTEPLPYPNVQAPNSPAQSIPSPPHPRAAFQSPLRYTPPSA